MYSAVRPSWLIFTSEIERVMFSGNGLLVGERRNFNDLTHDIVMMEVKSMEGEIVFFNIIAKAVFIFPAVVELRVVEAVVAKILKRETSHNITVFLYIFEKQFFCKLIPY